MMNSPDKQKEKKDEGMGGMTEEEIEEFREAFLLFAKDRDEEKKITVKELKFVMEELEMPMKDDKLEEWFREMDPAESGAIDFATFLKGVGRQILQVPSIEEVMEGFKYLDKDGLGYLTVKEFRYLLASYGEKMSLDDIKDLLKDADPENDGKVKYDIFTKKLFGIEIPVVDDPKKKGKGKDSKKGRK